MSDPDPHSESRVGIVVLTGAAGALLAVAAPVVVRGAPLADDFNNCLAPQTQGVWGFFGTSWERLGAIRPARFLEIAVTTGVCQHLPFGFAIAAPLVLTLAVATLTWALLRDLAIRRPWPELGAALWLLQPLGTEAALWPAALHVPLGLACALGAVLLYRRGRWVWGSLATLAAALSAEQVILAVPVVVWLLTPAARRRRSATSAAAVTVAVLVSYLLWPGADPRLDAGVMERLSALADDLAFYVTFPAVGVGAHSIPLAVAWLLPWSLVALAAGAAAGALAGRRLAPGVTRWPLGHVVASGVVVVALVNVPVLAALPRQGSPRVFTPTWLVLALVVAVLGSGVRWRREGATTALGVAGGVFAAGAVLSLVLSVSVRLEHADFSEDAAHALAARVPEGGDVAVCGVRRTLRERAPRGAFAVHELVYDWAAEDTLRYYAGRAAEVQLAGELWDDPCPGDDEVEVVVEFDELVTRVQGR